MGRNTLAGIAAAINDSRFAPVEAPELPYISIEISVLTPLKKISSIDEFELGRHGIYISRDGRSGTFLPQVANGKSWSKDGVSLQWRQPVPSQAGRTLR